MLPGYNSKKKKAKKYAESDIDLKDNGESSAEVDDEGDAVIVVFFSAVAQLMFAVVGIIWYVVEWRGDIGKGEMAYSLNYN